MRNLNSSWAKPLYALGIVMVWVAFIRTLQAKTDPQWCLGLAITGAVFFMVGSYLHDRR